MTKYEGDIPSFFTGPNQHFNVRFNFLGAAPDDLPAYAEGYHHAGMTVVGKLASAGTFPDYEGYPVFFLYRHALELNMKALIYRGAKYQGLMTNRTLSADRFFRSHDLPRLLPALREVFDSLDWRGNFDLPGLRTWDDFCELVRGIDAVDHGSYAFRYPMDPTGASPHRHHLVLNVVAFARNMDPVLEMLNAAAEGVEDRWQSVAAAYHFLQEIAKEWGSEP